MNQETPQDKIREFFHELDKMFPPEHPFIVKWGPADTFKEYIEKNIGDIPRLEDKIRDLENDISELEDIKDDLDTLEEEVDMAIDDLESAISDPDEVDIEMIKGVITDLKDAIK